MASSFFSAASAVLKKTAAAAVDSHVGKTIRSTVDAHNPIAVRRGKFIDPGRLPTSSSPTETGTTISLSTNNDDANTTGSTSTTTSSSTEKQVIDKRRDEYTKWHQVSTPVGTVSVEVHGLRSSEENDDDASTSASIAAAKRLRRGTKFYALVLCEGQRHTTGQLEDLENQASILGAANEQRSKEKDSNEDEEDSEDDDEDDDMLLAMALSMSTCTDESATATTFGETKSGDDGIEKQAVDQLVEMGFIEKH